MPSKGKHLIYEADSCVADLRGGFDLVLCCPPYFHPSQSSSRHGACPKLRDLDEYATWTARVLLRSSTALEPGRALCFVKTDVKYKRTLLPVGFRIAEHCQRLGLPLRAHWIWRRLQQFSPYAPSFANIFIMGDTHSDLLRHGGLFETRDCASRATPTSFTPNLFELLVRQLTVEHGVVLDPFVGLGSTVVAASHSRRWSVGLEISRSQITKATHVLRDVPAVHFTLRRDRANAGNQ